MSLHQSVIACRSCAEYKHKKLPGPATLLIINMRLKFTRAFHAFQQNKKLSGKG